MRLEENPQLPLGEEWRYTLQRFLRNVSQKVNQMADGKTSAIDNALTAAPTTGQYAQGDFVRNSAPTVLGSAGSQYTISGWRCVVAGSPGTFVQCRDLTGT